MWINSSKSFHFTKHSGGVENTFAFQPVRLHYSFALKQTPLLEKVITYLYYFLSFLFLSACFFILSLSLLRFYLISGEHVSHVGIVFPML